MRKTRSNCSIPGCERPHAARGLCSLHYHRLPDRKEARRKRQRKYYLNNRAKILERTTANHKKRDPSYVKQLRERRYKTKFESIRKTSSDYYFRNKEAYRKRHKEHYENNKFLYKAKTTARRLAKLHRTPVWADLKAIAEFYKNCPPGYHVDHIIPLQGKNVSGLHVLGNLQYLPAKDNLSKGNRYGQD